MMSSPHLEPIAIVGVGCRFAGESNSPDDFWRLMRDGIDGNREAPTSRWNIDALFDVDAKVRKGKVYTKRAGFLSDITRFDPMAFGISPREAHAMDPQQRVLLEVTHEAFEDAGIPASKYQKSETGVYVGLMNHDYALMQDGTVMNNFSSPGSASSIASNRISFAFDLRGPSLTIDTACSSSLVGAHFAAASLRSGETDMAVVGGVNIIASPVVNIALCRIGMLSPDGRCKAFDASGDGYGRGEGAGVVILKRLSDAVRDGDQVYCTILGSSVNSDGRGSTPITAPNQAQQERMLRRAYKMAGVRPCDVQYMEAHGTGTLRGDPIEAGALGAVLSDGRPAGVPLAMGSVKTNIGHVEAGAGVAGLIKVCLSMRHNKVPPSLHFKNPNPLIDFDKLNMRVVTQLEPWPAQPGRPKLAGVNSFGFGGTNSHAVLSSPPAACDRAAPWGQRDSHSNVVYALPVSAYTRDALSTMAQTYAQAVRTTPGRVEDVCYTATYRRSRHKFRAVALGATHEQLAAALDEFAATGTSSSTCITGAAAAEPRVAFAFSGSGTAWPRMGAELMATHAAFRDSLRRMDERLQRLAGWSVIAELSRTKAESRLGDLRVCQVCIYSVQMALVDLLRSWGVQPVAVVGHSVGEVAASVTAGLMTVDQGLALVQRLGHFAHDVEGGGYMVTATTSQDIAAEAIAELSDQVGIAAVNDGNNVTLAGFTAGLDTVVARLAARGVNTARVALGAPFHTVGVEQHRQRYLREFADLPALTAATAAAAAAEGRPRMYSTCRVGAVVPGAADAAPGAASLSLDVGYWWDNARTTVMFAPVVTAATAEQGVTAWVEIGPTATLAVSLTALAKKAKAWVVPTMRTMNGVSSVAQAAASLFASGVGVDWGSMYEGRACRVVDLPLYPWNHSTEYWMESRHHYCMRRGMGLAVPLLGLFYPLGVPDHSVVFEADISTETLPLLADHVYQKSLLLPATMYMEVCLALGRKLYGDGVEFSLHGLDLPQAMWFAPDETREVRVTAVLRGGAGSGDATGGHEDGEESKGHVAAGDQAYQEVEDRVYDVTVSSRRKKAGSDDSQGAVTVHSSCVLRAGSMSGHTDIETVEFGEVVDMKDCGEVISKDQWYQNFAAVGFDFGPRFQNIKQAFKAIPLAMGEIAVGDLIRDSMGEFAYHPGILDAAGQVLDATVSSESSIPVNIGRVTPHKHLDITSVDTLYSYARMTRRTEGEGGKKYVLGDVFLFTPDGELLLTLADFSCQVLDPTQSVSKVNAAEDSVYNIEYVHAPLPASEATSVPGNSLVIVPRGACSIERADFTTLLASLGANETPRRCVVVEQDTRRPMSSEDLQALIHESFADKSRGGRRRRGKSMPQLKRVVLAFHNPRGFDDSGAGSPARARAVSHYVAATILHASQAVGAIFSRHMSAAPWLYFVTCGAVAPVGPSSGLPSLLSAVHAQAHGFRRTLAHEFPSLRLRCVDMGFDAGTAPQDVAALVDELGMRPDDEEVALRAGQRYVARYAVVPREVVSADVGASFQCRSDGAYVIIGGCRGLGLKLAGFLKQRGAGCLVLVSRSGVAPAAEAEVDALASNGVKVMVSKNDVTDEASVHRLFSTLADDPSVPPVRGVVHSAMVLDDGLVLSQTARRVERVLDPKVVGALLMHRACVGLPLDFFTLFSSTTALFGNQGQFSYGGANAFLDALSHLRRRNGMPGVAINWGAFKGIGYLARNTSVEKQLNQRGWEGIDQPTFFDFFARFTACPLPQTSLALADLSKWFRHQPWALTSPMYTTMAERAQAAMAADESANGSGAGELLRTVQGVGDSDALPVVVAWCRGVIAMSLDVTAEEVDVETSFPQLGVDSLMGMEVRNLVAEQLEVDMPLALMFGNTSVTSLSTFLLEQVRQKAPVEAADAAAVVSTPDEAAPALSTPGVAAAPKAADKPVPSPAAPVITSEASKAAASHLPYGMHAPTVVMQSSSSMPSGVSIVTAKQPVRIANDRAASSPAASHISTPSTAVRPAWASPAATHTPSQASPAPRTVRSGNAVQQPSWASPATSSAPAAVAPSAGGGAGVVATPATAVPTTVPATVLTAWLSRAMATKSKSSPLPKYAYPSPGSLHPVQVYLVLPPLDPAATVEGAATDVKSRVDGVPAGNYYYHPVEHQLYGLRDPSSASAKVLARTLAEACPSHTSGAPCPFYAVLVGNVAAIEPLYGEAAKPFLFFEAGAITRALKDGGSEAGVPLRYTTVAQYQQEETAALHDALALDESDHVLLRSVYVTLA